MSKKRTLLTVLAVVLVCCIAVTGTLAYLTAQTGTPVVNTFKASDPTLAEVDLIEHAAVKQTDGKYALDMDTEVTSNEYIVLPGTDLPKDPTIVISEKSNVPAYLYVEIVDELGEGLSYELADGWTLLSGVTGANGGAVYYYSAVADGIVNEDNCPDSVKILKGDVIKVADPITVSEVDGTTLTFHGYMAQASVGTPAEAYAACFLTA